MCKKKSLTAVATPAHLSQLLNSELKNAIELFFATQNALRLSISNCGFPAPDGSRGETAGARSGGERRAMPSRFDLSVCGRPPAAPL